MLPWVAMISVWPLRSGFTLPVASMVAMSGSFTDQPIAARAAWVPVRLIALACIQVSLLACLTPTMLSAPPPISASRSLGMSSAVRPGML